MKILSAILIVICFVACGKKAEHRSESGKEINATDTVSVKNEKTTGMEKCLHGLAQNPD